MVPYNKGKPHLRGASNPMYGKPPPRGSGRGRGGLRTDLGHYVRSRYEANYCRILKLKSTVYTYEPETFHFEHEEMSYTPDIYIPKEDLYIEIKGWMSPKATKKIELFKISHDLAQEIKLFMELYQLE
mgnify:CR=1 FL=1